MRPAFLLMVYAFVEPVVLGNGAIPREVGSHTVIADFIQTAFIGVKCKC